MQRSLTCSLRRSFLKRDKKSDSLQLFFFWQCYDKQKKKIKNTFGTFVKLLLNFKSFKITRKRKKTHAEVIIIDQGYNILVRKTFTGTKEENKKSGRKRRWRIYIYIYIKTKKILPSVFVLFFGFFTFCSVDLYVGMRTHTVPLKRVKPRQLGFIFEVSFSRKRHARSETSLKKKTAHLWCDDPEQQTQCVFCKEGRKSELGTTQHSHTDRYILLLFSFAHFYVNSLLCLGVVY